MFEVEVELIVQNLFEFALAYNNKDNPEEIEKYVVSKLRDVLKILDLIRISNGGKLEDLKYNKRLSMYLDHCKKAVAKIYGFMENDSRIISCYTADFIKEIMKDVKVYFEGVGQYMLLELSQIEEVKPYFPEYSESLAERLVIDKEGNQITYAVYRSGIVARLVDCILAIDDIVETKCSLGAEKHLANETLRCLTFIDEEIKQLERYDLCNATRTKYLPIAEIKNDFNDRCENIQNIIDHILSYSWLDMFINNDIDYVNETQVSEIRAMSKYLKSRLSGNLLFRPTSAGFKEQSGIVVSQLVGIMRAYNMCSGSATFVINDFSELLKSVQSYFPSDVE